MNKSKHCEPNTKTFGLNYSSDGETLAGQIHENNFELPNYAGWLTRLAGSVTAQLYIKSQTTQTQITWRIGQDKLAHAIEDCDPLASGWIAQCGKFITGPSDDRAERCLECQAVAGFKEGI